MNLRSRVINGCDDEKANIVKNNVLKENILRNNEVNININKRKRLHEERPKRVVLGERNNKVVKLDEQETNTLTNSQFSSNLQQNEIRNSTKRKRISSTSKSRNCKKTKLDLDVNDMDVLDDYPSEENLITTKDLYGFLFSNNNKTNTDGVFKEDRLHRLIEKEKYLPTSPVIDYLSPLNEVELKTRRLFQYAIVSIIMDKFHYRSETGLLAMAIFDDCWRHRLANLSNSRLIAITSVYIAAKYEEVRPLSIDELNRYATPSISKDDIIRTEVNILNAIDFNVIRPLSIEICRCFAFGLAFPERGNIILDYICFVVAADNKTAHFRPSTIASCAVIIACEIFNISPDNKRLLLMKKITKGDFSKILPEICKVVIDSLSLFSNSENNKRNNEINVTFDRKRYDRSTRYLYSRLPQIIGFYEDLIGKSE